MKFQRTMPEDEEKRTYKLVSEGEHLFQVTDVLYQDEIKINIKCEVISSKDEGLSVLYNISNDEHSSFFWLTKLFLKCINEPHHGPVTIDTDNWIGKKFYGEVKHNGGYANIKKLIYKDNIKQPDIHVVKEEKQDQEIRAWDET